jgi:hypothetical protein
MHLWSDGLEPVGDFEEAFALQDERVGAGWAPFWRYRDLGRYGEQLAHLYRYVDPERVLVVRYRDIVDEPVATVDRACRFLGLREGLVDTIPRDNSRDFVTPGWRPQLLGPVVRAGARAGAWAPPQLWRRASRPLVAQLSGPGTAHRPLLSPEQRARLVPAFAEDVELLSRVTGQVFDDWTSTRSRGSFLERSAAASANGSAPSIDGVSARR